MTPETIAEMKMGALIDKLYDLRAQKAELEKQKRAISDVMEELQIALMSRLDAEETIKACGTRAGVTISTNTVPNVDDWEAVYQYILENEAVYLLEKRMGATAWRELYAMGELIPGTSPFEQRTLLLRKLT